LLQRLQTAFIALSDAKRQAEPQDWLQWLTGQQWWPEGTDNSALALYVVVAIARFEQRNVRSLFVDEAQDYTAGQLALLAKLFGHASITLLGDHDQTLVHADAPFLEFGALLPRVRTTVVQLHTSYRATAGITQYFAQFADRGPGLTVGAVQSDPTLPTVLTASDEGEATHALIDALNLRNVAYSTAVIVPDTPTAVRTQTALDDAGIVAETVTAGAALPATTSVAVVPLALAKGLEFDSALVIATPDAYPATVVGRHRMYVACSRATKELTVIRVTKNLK
jgi:DNA helicase-2/ATP-dependent DNA helicase PcrA